MTNGGQKGHETSKPKPPKDETKPKETAQSGK